MRLIIVGIAMIQFCYGEVLTAKDEHEVDVNSAVPSEDLDSMLLGPFHKASRNPIFSPNASFSFFCPWHHKHLKWQAKDVFNPAALVRDHKVHLLFRAEDFDGMHAGTSRIGLARSEDGLHFPAEDTHPSPVLFPAPEEGDCCFRVDYLEDTCKDKCQRDTAAGMVKVGEGKYSMSLYDAEGGCEDPRVVQDEEGTYFMLYTSYDGHVARLSVASSNNLTTWTKHGLAFKHFPDAWSKAGAIVSTYHEDGRVVATRLGEEQMYYMYWGEGNIKLAKSQDLKNWIPVDTSNTMSGRWTGGVLAPRPGSWDSDLVEPGPPAMLKGDKILLIYNAKNSAKQGDKRFPEGNYAPGQAIFDASNPAQLIYRSSSPFLVPDQPFELKGQINNVIFVQGLVRFRNEWLLYYGTADSLIAVASSK
mmetsp:Transcript_9819/g.32856  ORF Transcript_9819/g.32856 Transcript_9819/m.32856 type:complete len:417 (-) Transcript_9819:71-1321(-)